MQQHVHQRVLHAHHAHRADNTASARQQAQRHFRQTELGLRVVQGNTAMTGQRDFQTATQCSAVQRGNHRNTEGFQPAQVALEDPAAFRHLRGICLGDLDQVLQVTTGKEGALCRGDDDTGDVGLLFFQTRHRLVHRAGVTLVHGVGGLLRVIQDQGDNVIRVFFPANG